MSSDIDEFKALAAQVEQEEREKSSKSKGGSFTYETIKWSGLIKNEMKVIRALGGVPNSGSSPFTARTIRHATIINDKNKRIKVVLPNKDDNPSYILWRVIDRVMDVDWIEKKKIYTVEKSHPDIFNIVAHNGFAEGSPSWKFDKGWSGRDYFLFNCIDRDPEVYSWSKANKHSVLLSKQINTGTNSDGSIAEYPEEGIPAYGFVSVLAMNIFKHYGDWRNYDLGITRTGLMENPMRVINASKYIEEVPEELAPLVVTGPLTDEESKWAMYDLDKLYGVTSYTKLWNNLRLTFAKIDVALGTHFMDELKDLADKEAKERQEKAKEEAPSEEESVEEAPVTESKSVQRRVAAQTQEVSKSELPPAYDSLASDEERNLIVGGAPESEGSKKWVLQYSPKVAKSKKYACQGCGTVVPEEFASCPVCGLKW